MVGDPGRRGAAHNMSCGAGCRSRPIARWRASLVRIYVRRTAHRERHSGGVWKTCLAHVQSVQMCVLETPLNLFAISQCFQQAIASALSTTGAYRAKRKILDEDEADYNRSFELIEAWLNDVKAKNPQTETVFMSDVDGRFHFWKKRAPNLRFWKSPPRSTIP